MPSTPSMVFPPACIDNSDLCAGRAIGKILFNHVAIVWQRGKAKVNHLLRNTPPETSIVHESTCRFPYEIVEVIISYLIHDHDALTACSLTCRSWYIAVVLHIHHTLILGGEGDERLRNSLKPLSKLQELGLIPLMKEVTVRQQVGNH